MKKLYTLAAAIAIPFLAAARPASPEVMRHTNPDGSVVEFLIFGDENFNYATDINRTNILSFSPEGYLAPQIRNGRVMNATPANIMTLAEEHLSASPSKGKQNRMAAIDFNGRSMYPTIGEVPALVILLEFSDGKFVKDDPAAYYNRFCNEARFSEYGGRGSVKDYFTACSNGKFSPNFEIYGPVKLKETSRYYTGAGTNMPNAGHNARFGEAIKEAIDQLDPTIDFSRYDLDNNGTIDSIFFIFSGYGQADTGNKDYVWPHEWDFLGYTVENNHPLQLERLIVDNVEVRDYACTNELNGKRGIPVAQQPYIDGIGAFCHEYGHVLGLPDFYDTTNTGTRTPGAYSVMADGSYNLNSTCPPLFSAYEQWVCRWIEFDEAADGSSYTLHPMDSADRNAMRIQLKSKIPPFTTDPDFYVFENRSNSGWDISLDEHGLYIWQIDFNKNAWTSNKVNANLKSRVRMVNLPGKTTSYAWPGEDGAHSYILPSQNILVSASSGKTLNSTISSITYDPFISTDVTFDYNKAVQLTDAPVLSPNPTAQASEHKINLEWSKVEGATDYLLTVERRDNSGNVRYVNGYNEKAVGNVLSTTIDNISEGAWTQSFTVWVRAYNGIPASATSNKIVFTPADLPEGSGVGEVEMEVPVVFGGTGCIHAPENAKVYTLGGIETGKDNLPAGIYIVKTETGFTAKVIVR